MRLSIEEWPISREMWDPVPKDELRNKFKLKINLVEMRKEEQRLYNILEYSDSLLKVRGIMARIVRANILRNKASITEILEVKDYDAADYFIHLLAM